VFKINFQTSGFALFGLRPKFCCTKPQNIERSLYILNKIYYADLPHRAVAVYLYLQSRADKDGKCFPSITTVASELKLSKSTVKRALADLEKSGFIRRERRYRKTGGNSSNMYFIRPP